MKKINIKILVAILIVFVGITSCDKRHNDQTFDYKGSIKEKIDVDPEYSLLKLLYIKSGLVPSLGATTPAITVFAPTNAALNAAGIMDTFNITGNAIRKILDYHIYTKEFSIADSSGSELKISMLEQNDTLFFVKTGTGYLANGNTPLGVREDFTNGYLYKIDQVLIPPYGNILGTLSNDSTLSYLTSAIITLNDPTINATIADGNATLFAPSNAAFRAVGLDSVTLVNLAPALLKEALLYHFTLPKLYTTAFISGTLTMANGGTTTLTAGSVNTIAGAGNVTPANIVRPNLIAVKGIIHIIDGVLLP